MTAAHNWLQQQLSTYQALDAREERNIRSTQQLLATHEDAFERSCLGGHITTSGCVITADFQHILLQHHAALNMWFTPGGHADGDGDLIAGARREIAEEAQLHDLTLLHDGVFDLDVHSIADNAKKDEPVHLHYDVSILFSVPEKLNITKNHESLDMKWVALDQVTNLVEADDWGTFRLLERIEKWSKDHGRT